MDRREGDEQREAGYLLELDGLVEGVLELDFELVKPDRLYAVDSGCEDVDVGDAVLVMG